MHATLVIVEKQVKQFAEGRTNVHNLQCSGPPSDGMSFDNVQQLCNLLEKDCRMMISELCCHLQAIDCSRSSVHKIVHNVLGFQKLVSRLALRLLINEHMKN